MLTEYEQAALCICASKDQHETAPSSACPLHVAPVVIDRLLTLARADACRRPREATCTCGDIKPYGYGPHICVGNEPDEEEL